jgi:mono/diheme cytochrome c family protein
MKRILRLLICCLLVLSGTQLWAQDNDRLDFENSTKPTAAEKLFVNRVEPLFIEKCGGCHGTSAKEIKGEFDMRTRASLMKGGESGDAAIILREAGKSPLVFAIQRQDGLEMPPKENDRLSPEQIAWVRKWIDADAPWPDSARRKQFDQAEWTDSAADGITVATSGGLSEQWTNRRYQPDNLWAYQPIKTVEVPFTDGADSMNPIDAFIERALAEKDIQPLPSADRATLIRRLTYDLTGLPPSPSEIRAFVDDKSENAYSKHVDRLLESRHYGEHWAKHWLDVVRYADSAGFANDFPRPNAWRYRDYVIRSLNDDKPYDQFMSEQVAGDEINPDDPDSLIAVGFLRMGPWEHTSMSVAAVTRQQFLDDVTNSVGVTFLAHELRCASCHDHKFDPIPTRDYYSMQAVFASVQFADVPLPYQAYENTDGFVEAEVRVKRQQAAGGVKSLKTLAKTEWPVEEWDQDSEVKGHAKVNNKRKQILARELKRFRPLAYSLYSGPDRPFQSNRAIVGPGKRNGNARAVNILTGGSIETPGEQVPASVLSVISRWSVENAPAFSDGFPQTTSGRRAALAKWLSDPNNPLPARVIANRVWQYHFGRGLAANPSNFGATGTKPTHPELLDFLANYLVENRWSLKKLHRLIVSSKAWRRAAGLVAKAVDEKDPDNQLYARFTPRRLTAEELRDSMLAVSGELNRQMGGIPARPEINMEVAMQPRHIMGSVAPAYQPDRTPARRNRRTIYAERIRTMRDPLLEVFNQPGLDTSCERRDASTITPQAFTLFNSQNSHDRSLALASRIAKTKATLNERIQAAFQASFGRDATMDELATCKKHYNRTLALRKKTDQKATSQYPNHVVRQMVEEMTGLTFYWVEDLDVYRDDYQADLKPWDVDEETRVLADICLVLFNSNEFIYVY